MATHTATYTQTNFFKLANDRYIPVNVKPCGIRCLSCDQEFSHETISEHMKVHIDPAYLKGQFNPPQATQPLKFDLKTALADDSEEDMAVKSFLPEHMPAAERKEKTVEMLQHNLPALEASQLEPGKFMSQPSTESDGQSGAFVNADHELPEFEDQIQIEKNIELRKTHQTMGTKNINLYENSVGFQELFDGGTAPMKVLKSQIKEKVTSSEYLIRKDSIHVKVRDQQVKKSTFEMGSSTKNLRRPIDINTASRFVPKPDKSEQTELSSRSISQRTGNRFNEGENHKCPCCQGFYCSVCRSDIPPQYRPVPTKDGKYEIRQDISLWYQDIYYKRKGPMKKSSKRDIEVCFNCENESFQGRKGD